MTESDQSQGDRLTPEQAEQVIRAIAEIEREEAGSPREPGERSPQQDP